MACREPSVDLPGVGVLCFGFSTPDQLTPLVARYKEKIEDCKNPVGEFVNTNVMITTQMICMEDPVHLTTKQRLAAASIAK